MSTQPTVAAPECTARVDVGGVIKHIGVFGDVLQAHHGCAVWQDKPLTISISAPSESDLLAIATAISRAVKAVRSRGLLGASPVFICAPPPCMTMGTYVTLQDVPGGCRPVMSSSDDLTDIMSLVEAVPDRQEYHSRATSTLFFWLRSLQYVRSQLILRIRFGQVKIAPRPAVTKLSWPSFSDYLGSPKSPWALTTSTKVSQVLDLMCGRTDLFWPTDHEQRDTLSVVFETTTVEIELDFSGSAEDGTYRLQLAGGSAWLPANSDEHGLELVSASPALAMDWGFHGISRYPDRSAPARKLAASLQRGVKYLNENPVGGRAVPRFSIPTQGQEHGQGKILRTILRRPHRFMYKDSAWCVEVTEIYEWTGSATTNAPTVECLVSAFQHEWDERLRPLDGLDETRPWTQDANMPDILPGIDTDVEARFGQIVEFTEELRLFLASAVTATVADHPEQSPSQP